MSITPFRGKCWHCGHDHDQYWVPASSHDFTASVRIAKLESELASLQAMYNAQCGCTDEWFRKYNAELDRKADATLLARCSELEAIAASANNILSTANARLERLRELARAIADTAGEDDSLWPEMRALRAELGEE